VAKTNRYGRITLQFQISGGVHAKVDILSILIFS